MRYKFRVCLHSLICKLCKIAIFFNLKRHFEQDNSLGGLWHMVTLCEPPKRVFNVLWEAYIYPFFSGCHMRLVRQVYQKCITCQHHMIIMMTGTRYLMVVFLTKFVQKTLWELFLP